MIFSFFPDRYAKECEPFCYSSPRYWHEPAAPAMKTTTPRSEQQEGKIWPADRCLARVWTTMNGPHWVAAIP